MALDLSSMRTVSASSPQDSLQPDDHNLVAGNIRTLGVNFDDATEPTAAQVVAGRTYSRSLDTNGELRHGLKEKTGSSSSETDWKKLAARVAHIHVVTSITGLAAAILAETGDSEGRKLYRPGQFVLNLTDGGLHYIYSDRALLPVTGQTITERIPVGSWIPTGGAAIEEHAGSNGVWPRCVLPDGSTSALYATVCFHNITNARLRFRAFCSSAASSGTAKIRISYRDIRPGDAVDSADDGNTSVDWTCPGAGLLGDVSTNLLSILRVDAGRRMLRLKLERLGGDAGDTLASDLHFYDLRVEQLSVAEQYTT